MLSQKSISLIMISLILALLARIASADDLKMKNFNLQVSAEEFTLTRQLFALGVSQGKAIAKHSSSLQIRLRRWRPRSSPIPTTSKFVLTYALVKAT